MTEARIIAQHLTFVAVKFHQMSVLLLRLYTWMPLLGHASALLHVLFFFYRKYSIPFVSHLPLMDMRAT